MASSRQLSQSSFFRRPTFLHFAPHPNNATPADIEFDESDLYFDSSSSHKIRKAKLGTKRMKSSASSISVPVSIPAWSTRVQQAESEDDGEERVPPHEYLAIKRGASLSVHEGVGRTLKGRDMSRVRNAVWKIIGFED